MRRIMRLCMQAGPQNHTQANIPMLDLNPMKNLGTHVSSFYVNEGFFHTVKEFKTAITVA